MTRLKTLGIICIIWGIIMLIVGIGAMGKHSIRDIGLSYVTQAILSFIVAAGLLSLDKQEK